jgi:hypothetical protein
MIRMGLAYVVEGVGVEWAVVNGDLRWRRCGGRITQRRRGRGGSRRRIGGDWPSRLGGDWSIGLLTGVGGFSSLGCEPVNFCDLLPTLRGGVCVVDGFSPGCQKDAGGTPFEAQGQPALPRSFQKGMRWRTSL